VLDTAGAERRRGGGEKELLSFFPALSCRMHGDSECARIVLPRVRRREEYCNHVLEGEKGGSLGREGRRKVRT